MTRFGDTGAPREMGQQYRDGVESQAQPQAGYSIFTSNPRKRADSNMTRKKTTATMK
jgi:hypothetical protein